MNSMDLIIWFYIVLWIVILIGMKTGETNTDNDMSKTKIIKTKERPPYQVILKDTILTVEKDGVFIVKFGNIQSYELTNEYLLLEKNNNKFKKYKFKN